MKKGFWFFIMSIVITIVVFSVGMWLNAHIQDFMGCVPVDRKGCGYVGSLNTGLFIVYCLSIGGLAYQIFNE